MTTALQREPHRVEGTATELCGTADEEARVAVRSGLAAVLGLAVAAGLLVPHLPELAALWFVDLAELLTSMIGAAGCAVAVRHTQGRTRRGWLQLTVGCACWAAGQLCWSVYELLLHVEAPFPSLADVGYLAFPVAAAAGLWLLPEHEDQGSRRSRLLDGLLVAGAFSLLSWQTTLGAVLEASGEGLLGTVVAAAYPVGDVVLVSMAVLVLAVQVDQRGAVGLLCAGLVCIAVADALFAYTAAVGTVPVAGPADVGWCVGFLLLGLAGVSVRRAAPGSRQRRAPSWAPHLSVLPYVPLSLAVVTVVVQYGRGHLDPVTFRLGVSLVALVLVRQYLALRDNQRLVEAVAHREAELRHLAFHDALTGLPNRALLDERVAAALADGAVSVAVAYVDVDGFKGVNDALGHAAGDELLVRCAERLRRALGPADTLARLGGDEFAALLVSGEAPDEVAQRLVEALRPPVVFAERQVRVSASVGVAVEGLSERPRDSGDLLRQADLAMYAVKRSGRNGYRVHEPGLRLPEADDVALHAALDQALRDGEVTAVFQPLVDVCSGRLVGVEALARWTCAGVPVSPAVFVPVAERGGLVSALTDVMLDQTCAQLHAWRRSAPELRAAVNVSRHELTRADLTGRVAAVLARHGLPGSALVVEVTESGLTEDRAAADATLSSLRDQGISISLDDFGTGYNSLSQLVHMPLDVVKIDRLFVQGVHEDDHSRRVLQGLLSLAAHLGLRVVAEGVERQSQLEHLRDLGVLTAQGYLLGRPCEASALTARLLSDATRRPPEQSVPEQSVPEQSVPEQSVPGPRDPARPAAPASTGA